MFKSAFSLVELLVVIAVIAVIAAIAIPNIAGTTQAAREASRLRNAQTVVSIYSAYTTYYQGANPFSPLPFSTKEDAVAALLAAGGLMVTSGLAQPTLSVFLWRARTRLPWTSSL